MRSRPCYPGALVTTARPMLPREAARSTVAPVAKRRAVFVDVLRLVASVQMVMGHSVDGLLSDALRDGALYDRWRWIRGLTSVAFMVAAGMSYYLSTLARFDRHKRDPKGAARRIRRGAVLVGLGYLLHLPVGALSSDPAVALAAWHELAMVDVLQCIGASILALEVMTIFARRPGQVVVACAIGAAGLFALAPIANAVDPSGPLRPLLDYLTHGGGSLFPLFPWAGYVLAGVVAAYLVNAERPDGLAWRTLLAALGAAALAMTVSAWPHTLVDSATIYGARPSVALIKLAAVLALVSALAFATSRVERLPRVLATLAAESLAIYVSHILVLCAAGVGVCALVGRTLSLPAAIGAGVAMIGLSIVAGLGWSRLKRLRAS